ncbi:hypothetical protein EYF80_009759 [Liparis tanakae]|uniref:Uncharacterized protein n=1 Tax=Liparis tanakae TaxID=230148 RepID=A0A4Z2IRR2_9TELE|nr:hypothetical protein EYF80_009759 [Liparis tanakae]
MGTSLSVRALVATKGIGGYRMCVEQWREGNRQRESEMKRKREWKSHSQCACIPAKTAVTDPAGLPDEMPLPCLHIRSTLGTYGDSWSRQDLTRLEVPLQVLQSSPWLLKLGRTQRESPSAAAEGLILQEGHDTEGAA